MKKVLLKILTVLFVLTLVATCSVACADGNTEVNNDKNGQETPVEPQQPELVDDPAIVMTDSYKAARIKLFGMSGIALPQLQNVTTSQESFESDTENGVRDEYQCEFVFGSAEEASQAYALFRTAITAVEGNQEETSDNEYGAMDIWSPLYPDAVIPYRDDVMMNIQTNAVSFFLMWRKQPIVFYSVATEGNGNAYVSYTGSDYQERRVERHWEIVDAFHGKVVAVADQGNDFAGWYVNGALVSSNATYNFVYDKEEVDFTAITFVAKFTESASVVMKESYAAAREGFHTITGFWLPELPDTEMLSSSDIRPEQHTVACFDITGTSATMATIISALQSQVGHDPSYSDENGTTWQVETEINGTTYIGDLWTMLDAGDGYSFVYVNYSAGAVAESYMTAREQFYAVTGVLLPLMTCVEVDEFPYNVGDKDYCFDITDGENLSQDTFETIKNYIDELDGWTLDDHRQEGVFDNYDYVTAGGDKINIVWHRENEGSGKTEGVYVNAFMK